MEWICVRLISHSCSVCILSIRTILEWLWMRKLHAAAFYFAIYFLRIGPILEWNYLRIFNSPFIHILSLRSILERIKLCNFLASSVPIPVPIYFLPFRSILEWILMRDFISSAKPDSATSFASAVLSTSASSSAFSSD